MGRAPVLISISRYIFVAASLGVLACHAGTAKQHQTTAARTDARVANLHAFARIYGVVRWFHPSDAAAEIDWDRFAIDGVHRVVDVADSRALRSALTELFAPIAPTVHIVSAGEPFPDEPALHPASTTGLNIVAWEHVGFGDNTYTNVYASKRRHRDSAAAAPGAPFAALSQSFDAARFRGARVRLRGKVRAANHGLGQLWLRVDRGEATGYFNNMAERPVNSPHWQSVEIIGTVAADATKIVFGTYMNGRGTTWYDELELATQTPDGAWTPLEIRDPGFESSDLLSNWSPGVSSARRAGSIDGWNATLDHAQAAAGKASLRIEAATRIVSEELFTETPAPGETVDVELGAGLRARIPLSLYSKDGHTLGAAPSPARGAQANVPMAATTAFDPIGGAADVIVVWNVLQHFWPYWDVVSVDWATELDKALRDALDDRNVDDHVATLRRLSAAAPDGHARTNCPGETRRASPPFAVDVIEGQVIVTATADKAVAVGDVIVSIDGRPAADLLAEEEALISGSPQWRRVRARERFGKGLEGSAMALRVQRGGTNLDATVRRGDEEIAEHFSHPPIDRLEDGVYYVDLSRAPMPDINAVMERLAAAPGVVFDLRGYPAGNHEVLSHLLTRPDDSKAWMAVAHVIRPDHAVPQAPHWETFGWSMPVLQPHIAGRVAFLTGPRAASYAESVMGLVEHYRLGEIVGSATAGTNGNVAEITTPNNCRTWFTGLRVTKHDGSQHHLIGIQPTIPAARTIAGVLAGRDEILDKALAYVRGEAR